MIRRLTCTFLLAGLAACVTPATWKSNDAELLAEWMSGTFSSAAQSAAEIASGPEAFRALVARHGDHADVRLHVVPVWTKRADGYWLYVERARANDPRSSYFQRVVRVHVEGHLLVSDTYLLPGDEHRFDGAWRATEPLSDIAAGSLVRRSDDTLYWSRTPGGTFTGVLEDGSCSSVLQGATHAVSRMSVSSNQITSWDQGFDESGKQVWGVTSGPYVFEREAGGR